MYVAADLAMSVSNGDGVDGLSALPEEKGVRVFMSPLTNMERAELRRLSNQMKPLVQIGKNGLTEGVKANLDQALENHELVKVKFLDFQDEKKELTDEMVTTTGSILVSLVGNIATLYRQQPDPDKRKIDL